MPADRKGANSIRKGRNPRLTDAQVVEIFAERELSQKEMAAKFRVTQGQISKIQRGQQWRWLTSSARMSGIANKKESS